MKHSSNCNKILNYNRSVTINNKKIKLKYSGVGSFNYILSYSFMHGVADKKHI